MNCIFDQSSAKRKFEEGPMAVFVVVPTDKLFWATSSSTSTTSEAGIPDFTDLMKQLALSSSRTFTLSPSNSQDGPLTVFVPEAGIPDFTDLMKQLTLSSSRTFTLSPPNSLDGPLAVFAPAHNNNTFTFSATSSSSTSAAPKTGIPDFTYAMKKFKSSPQSRTSSSTSTAPKAFTDAMKKFKPSPPSRRSATSSSTSTVPKAGIHDFDDKFNKLMEQFTPSSETFSFSAPPASAPAYEGFFKVNTNISTLKATADDDKILRRRIYNDIDSVCQRPEFVVPPHIKEFCDLALEKYNNENGTIYRYVCPTLAYEDEDAKAHETTHHFIFKASASDSYYDSETFEALIKSGFRFSEGSTSYFKEILKVSRLPENV